MPKDVSEPVAGSRWLEMFTEAVHGLREIIEELEAEGDEPEAPDSDANSNP